MTRAFIRKMKGHLDTETHRKEGHVTKEAERGVMYLSLGMPRIAGNYQKLEEEREKSSLVYRGNMAQQTPR